MVEFADMITDRGRGRDVIIFTDVLSVTDTAVLALMFRCWETSAKGSTLGVEVIACENTVMGMYGS